MKINDIMTESWNPDKEYPDTKQGAIECFTDIAAYKPEEITKVYPDPYTPYVWAIHTKTKKLGSQKHVVYLQDKDFETDDRSGEEDFRVNESTTSGSVATVASPLGKTQKRGGNLLTGKKTSKKYANSISESKMKQIAMDLENMQDGNFRQKYKKSKDQMKFALGDPQSKKTVHEAQLDEEDLILVPGQGRKLKTGFIKHGESRVDHEVEMARSDLFQAAKNAKQVYELIADVSEDQGLEGWVQEKIIKANDYLNTIREYLEGKQLREMTGGVIAGGGVDESTEHRFTLPDGISKKYGIDGETYNKLASMAMKVKQMMMQGVHFDKVVAKLNIPAELRDTMREGAMNSIRSMFFIQDVKKYQDTHSTKEI